MDVESEKTNVQNILQRKLSELLSCCNKTADGKAHRMISKAYNLAIEKYAGKSLADGTPFIVHHLDLAITAMKEVGLGNVSAVCALLHSLPAIEGEKAYKSIEKKFGNNIANILRGMYKVTDFHTERLSFHSDSFRNMFLSLIDDIRVILLLLAHRLNDVRHPDLLTNGKKIKFFDEIKFIYIPIAHRLGLYNIKSELEERQMVYEFPDIFDRISRKIKETKSKREVYIKEVIRPLERELMAARFNYKIKWRTKSVPSIWAKMKRQNVSFEEVYDLFAIRIIIKSKSTKKEKEDCWKVYSIVTNIYQPNPKRLRDWISTPKASGYESLHTTVMGPNNKWVEVQIRTLRMDEVAEKGTAAHWQYKGLMKSKDNDNWLAQVRDILENPEQIEQDAVYRSNHISDNIFVFTPKGDLKKLPTGSTVLDFAYEIHTNIGARCSGANVNNKNVPIRHVLCNGDKVDIVTSNKQKPKFDWLAFVNTNKARLNIKKQLKEEKYKEAEVGKALLLRKIKNWKLKSTDDLVNILVKYFKLDSAIDLYYLVASNKLDLAIIKETLLEHINKEQENTPLVLPKKREVDENGTTGKNIDTDSGDILYIGDNLKNVDYRLSLCCNPVPGDKVFGFITTMGGISIHRYNCPNAKRLRSRYPYRVITVKWTETGDKKVKLINLRITGNNQLGIVKLMIKVITGDLRVNMRSVNFKTKGSQFEGKISLLIYENKHLEQLIYKLNQIKGVEKVTVQKTRKDN